MTNAANKLAPKLIVILHADVVGSTALVHIDEGLAHQRIRDAFRRLSEQVAAYGGVAHEVRGDALLAEFSRSSDAVSAAVSFQAGNAVANASINDPVRPEVRIGISLGEVVIADGTLTGPDVVLAQRLEQLAAKGGVCVSDSVRQSVPGRLPFDFESLGEQAVKGFEEPIRAFAVSLRSDASIPEPRSGPVPLLTSSQRRLGFAVILAVLLVAGAGWWWLQPRADFEPVDPVEMAHALPDKPSIVVLPFANLGADVADDVIGDGITDSAIAVLASSPDIFVISRNTSFKYKGQTVSPREVATALGVRYVLEGSFQRAGEELRITTLLADAITGRNLWSDRFDTTMGDLFAVQDEIVDRIVENLHVELTVGSQARNWIKLLGGLEAYLSSIRARAHFQTFSPEGHAEAARIWGELLAKYPEGVYEVFIGWIHYQKMVLGISKDPREDLRTAMRLGKIVAQRHPDNAIAFTLLATVVLRLGEHEAAMEYADRALELEPGGADVNMLAGYVRASSGMPEDGVVLLKRGMRYEPDYPHWVPAVLVNALIMLERYEEAEAVARGVLAKPSEDVRAHPTALEHLAVIAELTARHDEAEQYVVRLLEHRPDLTSSHVRSTNAHVKDQDYIDRRVEALRRAGLPEGQ